MSSGAGGPPHADGARRGEIVFYEVSVLFPLVTGGCTLAAGISLAFGSSHRMPWSGITYFVALALIIGGAITYFVIGLWLLPASMVVGGTILFAANQTLVYLGPWSLALSAPFLVIGVIAVIWGWAHARLRSGRAEAPS
jgi:hypothetical protein